MSGVSVFHPGEARRRRRRAAVDRAYVRWRGLASGGIFAPEPVEVPRSGREVLAVKCRRSLIAAVLLSPFVMLVSLRWNQVVGSPLFFTMLVGAFEMSRFIAAGFHRTPSRGGPITGGYEPSVSFVIPCKDEGRAVEASVVNAFEAHYPQDKLEVIVVDDGSTDATPTVLAELQDRYPRLKVITFERNRGKRQAVAEGFRRARGEIVVQLDSDSYVVPWTLRDLVAPFVDRKIGAVCAHARPANADTNMLTKMQAAFYFRSFRIMKAAESTFLAVLCCSGCASAYRRTVVLPVLDKWLAETFLGKPVTWGDDRALTNRVLRRGYRTLYTNRAHAFTICPDSLRTLFRQQVRWKKGWFVNSIFITPFMLKKHPFVALTYFLPLVALTLVTPFVAIRLLVWMPFVDHTFPVYYPVGMFVVALVVVAFYRTVERDPRHWPFVFLWSALELVVLSFVLLFALATLQNRSWGTR